MAYSDLTPAELEIYRSTQTAPDDFDAFWADTLGEARSAGGAVSLEPVDAGLTTLDVFDVTFPGFAGQPIRAWLKLPRHRTGPLPAVVEYVGYGGGRGRPMDNLLWASSGVAHLLMDTRGQGSSWSAGDTADDAGTGPAIPGVMTRGVDARETYYYRRLFTDAVRAVDAVRSLDLVDASRVAVTGTSQGGGISIAVGGLAEGLAGVVPHVPFLCDFPRALVVHDTDPYSELRRYLAIHREKVAPVLETLRYFDGVNFAARATAPATFTVALMDETCKPSTVYGAFHAWAAEKSIEVFPFNGHEGGGIDGQALAVRFLQERLGVDPAA